jgi:hypothetical protein
MHLALTVSASQREPVRDYIERQEEHHRRQTFREEYLTLLQRSGVKFYAGMFSEFVRSPLFRPPLVPSSSSAPAGADACRWQSRWLAPTG